MQPVTSLIVVYTVIFDRLSGQYIDYTTAISQSESRIYRWGIINIYIYISIKPTRAGTYTFSVVDISFMVHWHCWYDYYDTNIRKNPWHYTPKCPALLYISHHRACYPVKHDIIRKTWEIYESNCLAKL